VTLHRSYGSENSEVSILDAAKATLASFDIGVTEPLDSPFGGHSSEFTNPIKLALMESAQLWKSGNKPLLVSLGAGIEQRPEDTSFVLRLPVYYSAPLARAAASTHKEVLEVASRQRFRYYRFDLSADPAFDLGKEVKGFAQKRGIDKGDKVYENLLEWAQEIIHGRELATKSVKHEKVIEYLVERYLETIRGRDLETCSRFLASTSSSQISS
jgi:hypothetical protein